MGDAFASMVNRKKERNEERENRRPTGGEEFSR